MKLTKINASLVPPIKNGHIKKGLMPLSDAEKIQKIKLLFGEIMEVLGLDLHDESLMNSPERVAKMFVKESFKGLNPQNYPQITLFNNKYNYHELIVEKEISVNSYCEHHFVPIIGKAAVGYIPDKKIIGLSKINRLVDFFSRKPQVQEKLTMEITDALKQHLETENVAVVIEAKHLCVSSRGINDTKSMTTTSYFGGKLNDAKYQQQFFS